MKTPVMLVHLVLDVFLKNKQECIKLAHNFKRILRAQVPGKVLTEVN